MSDLPVADHAFLSDCRTSALVTRDGSVDWWCLPRFDSPAVHARLLDPTAGHFLVRPADPLASSTRRYLPHTLVLETTWTTNSGTLVVHDALALGAHERGHDIGRDSPGVLLRHVRCVAGDVETVIEWVPRPEFGLVKPRLTRVDGGLLTYGGAISLLLSTDLDFDLSPGSATCTLTLSTSEELGLAVQQVDPWGPAQKPWTGATIRRRVRSTMKAWQSWSALHQTYEGPFAEQVHHSGLVLQGLTYAHTGAIVAAPTTSLPEGEGTGRTWDYRFTWVRDASMTMRGLWVSACPDEASRFFSFLARAAASQVGSRAPFPVMFGIGGEQDLAERELAHLVGWRGSGPVRLGNAAATQSQHDLYGALLDAAYVLRDHLSQGGAVEPETQRMLVAAAEAAAEVWRRPDQGIWEIRGPARHYLHSVLMCWVALDRAAAIATLLGVPEHRQRWLETRDEIRDVLLDRGWNEDAGTFTQCLRGPEEGSVSGGELDASVLLIGLVGILPPHDPRVLGTIDAVQARLVDRRGLVRRYQGDDGLDGEEGSFLLCTFWLAEALATAGRVAEAEAVLRHAAGFANDVGLLAEEVDTATGQLLGNYPQAFSHLGLVLASQALATAVANPAPPDRDE